MSQHNRLVDLAREALYDVQFDMDTEPRKRIAAFGELSELIEALIETTQLELEEEVDDQ